MSLEPKPRSMAAVTMDIDRCSSENKIWLFAGTSEYLPVLPRGSDNLWSADNQQERPRLSLQAGRGILRDHTPDVFWLRPGRTMRWSGLYGDMQSTAEMVVPLSLERGQE